jgi:pimeloyl-ACP methyl ester carboxylesterase
MRVDLKLLCVVCSSFLWLACSDTGNKQNPNTGAGAGGASGGTGGTGGASGGAGGMNAGTGGASGMDSTAGAGGMNAGTGGAAGMGSGGVGGDEAGTGGVGGDATGGMGGAGGDDDPNAVEANPDGVDVLEPLPEEVTLPIVFVHGYAGSAQQYDSQMQRFVMNGYPQDRILDYDHDGAGLSISAYADGADAVINKALEDFGVEQVYLVGHSRGTSVGSSYLGNAARRAKVAKYISLDGEGCLGISIPCLAPTQTTIPGQAHVEVATSAESFAAQYEFLVGEAPTVTAIVPQKEPVTIRGRAVNFPANTGRSGTTLEVWTIDETTGHRLADEPIGTFEIGADGEWGPVTVDSRKRYEFALVPSGAGPTHHLYQQKFLRDTDFVRLLSGEPESATRMNTHTSDMHSTLVLSRMREWYAGDDADLSGDQADTLEVATMSPSGGDEAAVNVLQSYIGNGTIGLHVHDAEASPGDSSLEPLPFFGTQAFQGGIDVFMPATEPPDGTITITNVPRGDAEKPQVLGVPNWQSSKHSISVMFSDYAQ